MFEVHLSNSENFVKTLFKSDNLEKCQELADNWNNFLNSIHNVKTIDDDFHLFVSIFF